MLNKEEMKISDRKFHYPVKSKLPKTSFKVKYVPSRNITT